MRRYLLFFSFLLINCSLINCSLIKYSAIAQEAPEYVNVNLVQPDVWQIPGLPEAGIDAGGDLNLTIPVMAVPGRGMSFDISFSYNSNITLTQQASWLGLGWSFDPGSITREPGTGAQKIDETTSEIYSYGVDGFDIATGDQRLQPDAYYLSIPGRGSVQFTQAHSFFESNTIPNFVNYDFVANEHRSWKITASFADNAFDSCEIYAGIDNQCNQGTLLGARTKTTQIDIEKFVVTTDDGMRYVFEAPTIAAIKTAESISVNNYIRQYYVNTWRLRSILGVNYAGPHIPSDTEAGDWIRFDYSGVYYGKTTDYDIVETRFLNTIVTPTHKAVFNTAPRREENLSVFTDEIAGNPDPNTDNYPYQKLEKIELKRRTTNVLVRSVELIQNTGAFGPGTFFEKKRLGLTDLKYLDSSSNEQYRFEMDYNCDIEFSGLDMWEMDDDFGFLKPGASGMSGCSSTTTPRVWRLTKLTYPSGGTESYSYEFDEIDTSVSSSYVPEYTQWEINQPSTATVITYSLTGKENFGGSRISQISRNDGMGGSDITTTYDYGTGYVSGVPHLEPGLTALDIPIYLPSSRAKTRVSYEWVKRIFSGHGSVKSYYTTPNSYTSASSISVDDVNLISTGVQKVLNAGQVASIVIMQGNEDWNWGKEYRRITRGDDDQIIQIIETDYDFSRRDDLAKVFAAPFETYVTYIQSRVSSTTDKRDCGTTESSESTEAACVINYSTDYSYHDEGVFTTNQVVSTSKESQGLAKTTEIRYAHQEYTEADGMRSFNMLSQVYSTAVRDTDSGALLQKNWTTWDGGEFDDPLGPITMADVWRPIEAWQWTGSGDPQDPTTSNADLVFKYKAYNGNGLIDQTEDAAGTVTTYTWSHDGALPSNISSDPIVGSTLTTSATYDNNTFQMKSLTGPDNVATHFEYDAFGRLKEINETATSGTPIAEYMYELKGSSLSASNPNYTETRLNSSNDQVSRTYFDGLGRPIQTQLDEGADAIVTAIDYDNLGRELAIWAPYSKSEFSFDSNHGTVGGSGGTAQNYHGINNPYVRNFYKNDPLNRLDKMEFEGVFSSNPATLDYGIGPLSGKNYDYTISTDENGNTVKSFTDMFGSTKRIESDISASETAVTTFTYNVLGQLLEVVNEDVQSNNQKTTYTYDARGRLTTKSAPDANGDFEYRYDIRDNLRFMQDPNQRADSGRYLYNKYDDHNRLIEVGVYNPGTSFSSADPDNDGFPTSNHTVKADYNYVGAQLDKVTFYNEDGDSGYYEYDYDDRGRINKITVKLPNLTETKIVEYEYDLQGRITKMSYENNQSDHFYHWYNYDNAGRLVLVEFSSEFNNQSLANEAATYEYWPNGQVRTLKLGDSANPVQTVDYTYNIRGWLESINDPNDLTDSGSLGDDAFGLELAYESNSEPWVTDGSFTASYNGNVASAMWATNVLGQSGGSQVGYVFDYDGLNRLKLADGHQKDSGWGNGTAFDVPAITYDKVGNIMSFHRKDENGSGTDRIYGYETGNNRLESVTGRSNFLYDDNGNIIEGELTEGITSELSYDYRNLPATIKVGATTYNYSYDANGQRIYSSADNAYYIRGAGGEVVAVFSCSAENCTPSLSYWNLLAGSEVIGRQTK